MPSCAPAPASPRRPVALLLVAGLALGGAASTGLTAVGLAAAPSAVAAAAPTDPALVLRDASGADVRSGDARALPSFATATAGGGCPADADDGARLSVASGGASGGSSSSVVVSATVPTTPGQAVTVPMQSSFDEVVAAGVDSGDATLTLECLVLQSGVPATVVAVGSLPVTFAAGTWSVPGSPVVVPPTDAPTPGSTGAPGDPGDGAGAPGAGSGAGSGAGTTPGTGGAGTDGDGGSGTGSAGTRPGGALAFTGAETAGLAALAAGLLAGGAALVLRRRRALRAAVEGTREG